MCIYHCQKRQWISPFSPFKPPFNPLKGESETQIEHFWYWLYPNFYFHKFLSHSNGFEEKNDFWPLVRCGGEVTTGVKKIVIKKFQIILFSLPKNFTWWQLGHPGSRTPIGTRGNYIWYSSSSHSNNFYRKYSKWTRIV